MPRPTQSTTSANACSSNRLYLACNLADVAAISAAASAPHVHMREALGKLGHLSAEFLGIAIFEMPELA